QDDAAPLSLSDTVPATPRVAAYLEAPSLVPEEGHALLRSCAGMPAPHSVAPHDFRAFLSAPASARNGRAAHRGSRKGGLTLDDRSCRFNRECESPPQGGEGIASSVVRACPACHRSGA